jgi:hypothetical protein
MFREMPVDSNEAAPNDGTNDIKPSRQIDPMAIIVT